MLELSCSWDGTDKATPVWSDFCLLVSQWETTMVERSVAKPACGRIGQLCARLFSGNEGRCSH